MTIEQTRFKGEAGGEKANKRKSEGDNQLHSRDCRGSFKRLIEEGLQRRGRIFKGMRPNMQGKERERERREEKRERKPKG